MGFKASFGFGVGSTAMIADGSGPDYRGGVIDKCLVDFEGVGYLVRAGELSGVFRPSGLRVNWQGDPIETTFLSRPGIRSRSSMVLPRKARPGASRPLPSIWAVTAT